MCLCYNVVLFLHYLIECMRSALLQVWCLFLFFTLWALLLQRKYSSKETLSYNQKKEKIPEQHEVFL